MNINSYECYDTGSAAGVLATRTVLDHGREQIARQHVSSQPTLPLLSMRAMRVLIARCFFLNNWKTKL